MGPARWLGRYRRPMGQESCYHISSSGAIEVRWQDDGYNFNCPVINTPAIEDLAASINEIKRKMTGVAGGSFVINEFGQVIVPIYQSTDRFLVGQATGRMWFQDPWESSRRLCLDLDEAAQCGDDWNLPYLGMQYQLSAAGRIYYWREDGEGGRTESPPVQDESLIQLFRKIRPYGAVRFIVNQHGLALTKKHAGGTQWKGVFVGRINLNKWFNKEETDANDL